MKVVLVVDDNLDQNEVLINSLKHEGGFLVSFASSEQEAIIWLEKNPTDLILSDLQMPNGDGWWLLKNINLMPYRSPPVMILSEDPGITEEEALKAGAVAFFQKPYNTEDVIRLIKEWLG